MNRRLSKREKATAAASLLELRAQGIDAAEVERAAETMIRIGTPEPQAWGKAFGKVLEVHPSLRAPLMRIEALIDRVDTPTLARYSLALEKAYTTGNMAALQALALTITQDMAQMARETGDAGYADGLPDVTQEATPATAAPQAAPAPARPGWQAGGAGFRPSETKQQEASGEAAA